VLATWFYIVSQLIMLGAVFIQFRLGKPDNAKVRKLEPA
jgi:uncharacterized BrkB/YihY/UPF0761 family membrane protein